MRTRAERGFTLLEVLIATVIMAVAVAGLMSALGTAMHNAARLTDRDRALILARQKMDELLIDRSIPAGATAAGQWDPVLTGGLPCGWRTQISVFEAPQEPAPGSAVLERVGLEVWWGDGDAKRTFALEGFRRGEIPLPAGPQ